MDQRRLRSLLIIISLLVVAGLYFAPSQVNVRKAPTTAVQPQGTDMTELEATAMESLDDERKGYIAALKMKLKAAPSPSLYDSLVKAWDDARIPVISAWYAEQKAASEPSEKNHLAAAYRYFDAFKIAEDSALKAEMVTLAMKNYEKVLALNPKNLNAKTDLAVCYAEGSAEPMKGIMMLREVVNEDPRHEMAQLNLGFLSMKSAQYEKAIDRFTTVMSINPTRKDIYYFLGRAYLEKGNTDSSLYWFEKLKKESDDYVLVQQADKMISGIRQNNIQ
jgi:tetratricopeptide (TPR) repeat protein